MQMRRISYQLSYGPRIAISPEVSLRPVSRALVLRLGRWVGWVWNRPVAVQVLGPGDQQRSLPVRDTTRRNQLLILAAAWLLALLVAATMRKSVR